MGLREFCGVSSYPIYDVRIDAFLEIYLNVTALQVNKKFLKSIFSLQVLSLKNALNDCQQVSLSVYLIS